MIYNSEQNMKKVYIDKSSVPGPASIWIKDAKVIWAGAVISSMSIKHKNEDYKKVALEHDVHFIFDDEIPVVDFYTVPLVDIFAMDSTGGYIGSIGEAAYFGSNATICYISPQKECFFIAKNFSEFINHLNIWNEHMVPYNELEFFCSKEDADNKYEFLDMSEFTRIDRIMHMEKCFDELLEAQKIGIESIFTNNRLKKRYGTVKEYYENGLWLQDYEADERGELPADLKRGVLSQDALYDLLSEIDNYLITRK